jgi:hypothetical protein
MIGHKGKFFVSLRVIGAIAGGERYGSRKPFWRFPLLLP